MQLSKKQQLQQRLVWAWLLQGRAVCPLMRARVERYTLAELKRLVRLAEQPYDDISLDEL